MKYSLVIHKDNDDTLELSNYGVLLNQENFDETSLRDIIKFTNDYADEEELTEVLLEMGLIPQEYMNGSYGIRYYRKKDGEPKLLQYGISFKRDKKFYDKEFLISYYSKHLVDIKFMEAFLERYYKYLKNTTIFESDLNDIRRFYLSYVQKNILPYNAIPCMERFVNYYTTNKDKDGNYKESPSRLRDLAMFAINFERCYNRLPEKNKFKNPDYIKNLEMELEHYKILLEDEGLTQEEYEAYLMNYDKLTHNLELVSSKDYSRTRSISTDEITEY